MGRFWALSFLALAVVLALAGCGGGGGSSDTSTSAPEVTTTKGPKQQPRPKNEEAKEAQGEKKQLPSGPPASAFHPKPHHDSGGGSDQYVVKGGDNSVQDYGQEASQAELEEAAAALHGFLDARAQGNWAAACGYLSAGARQSMVKLISKAAHRQDLGCATVLAALSEEVPRANLREAAIADVGSLREEGDHAFLIYRGAKGLVFGISITREGDAWKLETLGGTPIAN